MRTRSWWFIGIVALGLGAIVGAARAEDASAWTFQQFQPAGQFDLFTGRRSGFRPPLAQRDLDAIANGLGLDTDQRGALTDLNRSLVDEFKAAWVSSREAKIDAQLTDSAESGGEAFNWSAQQLADLEQDEALRHEQDRLVDALFTDLRLLLTPEQEKRWANVERDRRRATTLGAYAFSDEESLDLVSIANGLELTAEQRGALNPMLEQYADQLDAVLGERARAAEIVGEAGLAYFRDEQRAQAPKPGDGPDRATAVVRFWQERDQRMAALVPDALALKVACDHVRDCNRRFVREIGALIPTSAQEEWTKAVTAKRAPSYGKAENLSRALRSIRILEDLQKQVADVERWGNGNGMEYLQILQGAEPLTAAQQQSLSELENRLVARVEEIGVNNEPIHDEPADAAPDVLSLQTPKGTMIVRRASANDESSRRVTYGGMGMQRPDAKMTKEISALDIEALKELRSILTINQRAVISMW